MINITYKVPETGNYIITIKSDHTINSTKLLTTPTLEELKSGIGGGLIEIVPFFNKFMKRDCVVFCDEEGKLKNMKRNLLAQTFWEAAYGKKITDDYLVGDIVIIVGSLSFLSRL
jgi:hypothetical protein